MNETYKLRKCSDCIHGEVCSFYMVIREENTLKRMAQRYTTLFLEVPSIIATVCQMYQSLPTKEK
jgi:hypothetical protein